MKKRGLLIVFEGLDRSGKSTQARKLFEALNANNLPTEFWRYPNRETSIGQLINGYLSKQVELDDHAVHLLFSANRWETVDQMKEKLNSGVNLVVDRYAYSGVAYTSAKPGFDIEWCKQCDIGLPKPDAVYFLDTKKGRVDTRQGFGEERYESSEFQKIVYHNFGKLFDLESRIGEKCPQTNCIRLNAASSIEELHETILNSVLDTIKEGKLAELGHLW